MRMIFWQLLSKISLTSISMTHIMDHSEHRHAMRLHIARATQHETNGLNILNAQSTHLFTNADLRSLKRRIETSKRHATAGLMQLRASDADDVAREHAIRAGDHEEARKLFKSMRHHGQRSLNHTPTNEANFDAKDSILNARHGRKYAKEKSKEYIEQERKRGSINHGESDVSTPTWLFS